MLTVSGLRTTRTQRDDTKVKVKGGRQERAHDGDGGTDDGGHGLQEVGLFLLIQLTAPENMVNT